jgi:hypothetical protein
VKMLDDLKELENGGFEGYGEKHNWTKLSLGPPLCKDIDTTSQYRFDALGA